MTPNADLSANPTDPSSKQPATIPRNSSLHDRKTFYELVVVLGVLLLTIALSIVSGQDLYIFGYVVVIVYALLGPTRRHPPCRN
jgi:hypothetical protein